MQSTCVTSGAGTASSAQRAEAHALPAVVHAAPRRHAVEVADVFGLRQLEELLPGHRERDSRNGRRLRAASSPARRPASRRDRAPASSAPGAGRSAASACRAITRAAAFGRASLEDDVDALLVQLRAAARCSSAVWRRGSGRFLAWLKRGLTLIIICPCASSSSSAPARKSDAPWRSTPGRPSRSAG